MYEVELKFRADGTATLVERLADLGATASDSVQQADRYFNHPSRDFAQTDEAVRIRTVGPVGGGEVAGGSASRITYKGPKQGGRAKTRFELELPLAEQTADGWAEMLVRLGFVEVAAVIKQRTAYHLERTGRRFEVSLDAVEGLGGFAEVETLAGENDREAAEQAVLALAAELGLAGAEPRSYLEMLLAESGEA